MSKYPVIILLTVSMSAMSLTACNNKAAVKATSTDTSVYVYEAGSEDQADTTVNSTKFNHGHSISEAGTDREREIRRSDTVITDDNQALKYLEESITLPSPDLSFSLTETSEKDPGAYMWYKFNVFYKDILVENAEFYVISFIDGAICEGASEIMSCTFEDTTNTMDPDVISEKYCKDNNTYNKDLFDYKDTRYFYTGSYKENIKLTYRYRYNDQDMMKAATIYLDAKTGERIGYYKDVVT